MKCERLVMLVDLVLILFRTFAPKRKHRFASCGLLCVLGMWVSTYGNVKPPAAAVLFVLFSFGGSQLVQALKLHQNTYVPKVGLPMVVFPRDL